MFCRRSGVADKAASLWQTCTPQLQSRFVPRPHELASFRHSSTLNSPKSIEEVKSLVKHEASIMKDGIFMLPGTLKTLLRVHRIAVATGSLTHREDRAVRISSKDLMLAAIWVPILALVPGSAILFAGAAARFPDVLPSTFAIARARKNRIDAASRVAAAAGTHSGSGAEHDDQRRSHASALNQLQRITAAHHLLEYQAGAVDPLGSCAGFIAQMHPEQVIAVATAVVDEEAKRVDPSSDASEAVQRVNHSQPGIPTDALRSAVNAFRLKRTADVHSAALVRDALTAFCDRLALDDHLWRLEADRGVGPLAKPRHQLASQASVQQQAPGSVAHHHHHHSHHHAPHPHHHPPADGSLASVRAELSAACAQRLLLAARVSSLEGRKSEVVQAGALTAWLAVAEKRSIPALLLALTSSTWP